MQFIAEDVVLDCVQFYVLAVNDSVFCRKSLCCPRSSVKIGIHNERIKKPSRLMRRDQLHVARIKE